jgi:hypothetical protein
VDRDRQPRRARAQADRPDPLAELDPGVLGVVGGADERPRLGRRGLRLPERGGRLRLGAEPDALRLDLWEGDDEGLSADDRRALAVATAMVGLALRGSPAGIAPPGGGV